MTTSSKNSASTLNDLSPRREELLNRKSTIESEILNLTDALKSNTCDNKRRKTLERQLQHQKRMLSDALAGLEKMKEKQTKAATAAARQKQLDEYYKYLLIFSGIKKEVVFAMDTTKRKTLAREKVGRCLKKATGGAANPKGNRDSLVIKCVSHILANKALSRFYSPEKTIKLFLISKKGLISKAEDAVSQERSDPETMARLLQEAIVKDADLKTSMKKLKATPTSSKTHALNNKTHWMKY